MFRYKEQIGTMFFDCELKKQIGDFVEGSKFYIIMFSFDKYNLELIFYNVLEETGDIVEIMRKPLCLIDI